MGSFALRPSAAVLIGAIVFCGGCASRSSNFAATGKVSDLLVPSSALGGGWHRSATAVDDIDNPPDSGNARELAGRLARDYAGTKLRGHADVTYVRQSPRQTVILSIDAFDDPDSARAYWNRRYASDPANQPVRWAGDAARADEASVVNYFLYRRVVISAVQLYNGPEKRAVLVQYLRRLGAPPPSTKSDLDVGRDGPR